MILPGLVRQAQRGSREPPPRARWEAALRELRARLARDPDLAIGHLCDYLDGIPPEDAPEAAQDLIAEHLDCAWRSGRRTYLEDYAVAFGARFQSLASPAALPAELVEDEFLARHALPGGDAPSLEEYRGRFPGRRDVRALLERRCLREGRYVKLGRLGRGALAEVWEARDRQLHRLVAVKEPRAELAVSDEILRRFLEEAAIATRLDHPGIVGVHEVFLEGGVPHCVMRLVRGRSLAERIRELHHPATFRARSETRLLRTELLRSFAAVCGAVAHAHSRGVVHRDLKAGNVMVGPLGETAVLDWGMATLMKAGSVTGEIAGTPEHMPPEQAGGRADARSDVFGLGAVLYEVLTGAPPHEWPRGVRPLDWERTVREARVIRPRKCSPGVPRALEAICLTALARDPRDRYPGAREVLRSLRSYMDRGSGWASGESRLAAGRRWLGRRLAPLRPSSYAATHTEGRGRVRLLP